MSDSFWHASNPESTVQRFCSGCNTWVAGSAARKRICSPSAGQQRDYRLKLSCCCRKSQESIGRATGGAWFETQFILLRCNEISPNYKTVVTEHFADVVAVRICWIRVVEPFRMKAHILADSTVYAAVETDAWQLAGSTCAKQSVDGH